MPQDSVRAQPAGTMSKSEFRKLAARRRIRTTESSTSMGWQRAIARELGMNERTIRRYASGETTIPYIVSLAVRFLCEEAQTEETDDN